MQNPHFGSKIKIPKNMSKSILKIIYSCSVQKTARKNTKYSRNESILKIGHHAKAIAIAIFTVLRTERKMARCFAKVSGEEIEEAFFIHLIW